MNIKDINLVINSNDKIRYYSGIQNCGSVIWDMEFGIFSNSKPDSDRILDFIIGTDWDGDIENFTNQNPNHGTILIDFDKKTIVEKHTYSDSNIVSYHMLKTFVSDAINDTIGFISKESVIEHLKYKRLYLFGYQMPQNNIPTELESANKYLQNNIYQFAKLELPSDWKLFKIKE